MNILPEIAAAVEIRKKMGERLTELTEKIAVHPKNVHEELAANLTRLKKNLSGTLVSESTGKRQAKTGRRGGARAPRGMRQWMLYSSIKSCAQRGTKRETMDSYYFDLGDIWDYALHRIYRSTEDLIEGADKAALKEDYLTFQSSSRTRISSDPLFQSEDERGRYRIVDYLEFVARYNGLEADRDEYEQHLKTLAKKV